MTRVRQRFASEHIEDVAGALRQELARCGLKVPPGKIAIAVGSRGIANLATLVRETVAWVRSQGGEPFIVPAMGSHGGATAAGQQCLLEEYGITEAAVRAPIRSSLAVVELDRGDLEIPVYMDAEAGRAAGVIVINRIKPHTSFHGRYESGLMKMMAVGLGKQRQAEAIHRFGVQGLRDLMPRVACRVARHGRILLGLGIVENAYDQTLKIRVLPSDAIPEAEPALLDLARSHMPRLPVEDIDLLIVDEMGKDLSGLGIDPNVVGRLRIAGQPEPASPRIRLIVVRDLTAASRGNAAGMGLADIVIRRLFEKIDRAATYENTLTSTFVERAKVPMIADTDREAMGFSTRLLRDVELSDLRIVRIRSTLHLAEVLVSSAVLRDVQGLPEIEVMGPAGAWFDSHGAMQSV
ncbi:MAG TPA: DUF2088 domain-containing protein [Phycisphaerae bacterium]|nr:DUF2088 domain-containing protein [Phycisphaerae bacterium]